MGVSKEKYGGMADEFRPEEVKFLFVAESPPRPKDDRLPYFYNPDTQNKNALWYQMKEALDIETDDKAEFLEEFQNRGYFLYDLFSTHQEFQDFESNQDSDKRVEIVRRFSEEVSRSEPERIAFICKRAAKLFSLPFPKYRTENKERFKREVAGIVRD